ncbi:MAG: Riboflavin transporter [Pseudomonadota bacterium]|jgi:drug/metabolite transporter (DMT)-like permease
MSQLLSDTSRNRQIGIALVTVTTLMFAVLDTSAKWLVQTVPVLQVVWLRFVFHALLTTAIFMPSMGVGLFKIHNPRLQLLRGVMLALMTGLNFFALQYLQLAETGAVQFSVPILIALISALWLHEKLDLKKWLAICMGFAGVLVIIRPGSNGFHPAILLSIMNALLYAAFNLMTRRLAGSDHPISTQLASAMVPTVVLAPFAIWYWQTPDSWQVWCVLVLAGLTGGLGHTASALAHRYATAAVLGPFLYQQIIYMSFGGWLIFGQIPDAAVVLGAGIVVLSGLYLLWREFKLGSDQH